MTNGDVIRSMTDEELIDFLEQFRDGEIDTAKTFCNLCEQSSALHCVDCTRWWVESDCDAPQGLKYWE